MELDAIFKSYDIRGEVGTQLTADVAYKLGKAFADFLPDDGVVAVGRDMRPDSEELAMNIMKGLQEQGRDVVDIGLVTSDMIYFAVGQNGYAGGAMVTASHNPGKDNGIKLCGKAAKAIGLDTGLSQMRDAIKSESFQSAAGEAGSLEQKDVSDDWVNHVLGFVDGIELKPLKLAVDAGNGMAGAIMPKLTERVPFEITPMYYELDGTFPNHEANPLKFETLKDLIKTVTDNNLDAGLAFDGDGDRAFLVDENGQVVTGGQMSAMLAAYFLEKYPNSPIVYDIRNSRTVPEVVRELGGTPEMERVGHSHLKAKMREVDAPFGGEASGHYYFRDNWYADSGLIAAVVALGVLSASDKKLSELAAEYQRYAAIPETNFEVADKDAAIDRIAAEFEGEQQSRMDGLLVTNDDWWVSVRASNTEPLLRLNAEASTQQKLDELVATVTELITRS